MIAHKVQCLCCLVFILCFEFYFCLLYMLFVKCVSHLIEKKKFILWTVWKLHQYWFYHNFKKIKWHDVLVFLVLPFILLMLIVSDDTICKRWWMTWIIKLLKNQYISVVETWRYTFSSIQISVNYISLISLWNTWKPMWC